MLSSTSDVRTFEIGVVYKSDKGRCYLATDKHSLITFVRNIIVDCAEPRNKFSVARSTTVEELCHYWGITLERLDEMSAEYFAPQRSNKARRRLPDKFSSRENYSQDMVNELWATHRTHRILRD